MILRSPNYFNLPFNTNNKYIRDHNFLNKNFERIVDNKENLSSEKAPSSKFKEQKEDFKEKIIEDKTLDNDSSLILSIFQNNNFSLFNLSIDDIILLFLICLLSKNHDTNNILILILLLLFFDF